MFQKNAIIMLYSNSSKNIPIFILLCLLVLLQSSCATILTNNISIPYAEKSIKIPELFAEGVISTKQNSEFDICFSPDGKKAYFTRRVANEKQKIYVTSFVNKRWEKPKIASFSTDRDENPFITPDGKTLYFGSERAIPNRINMGNFDMNIWKVELVDGIWSAPIPLPESINQVQLEKEEWPSSNENSFFSHNGKVFYLATMLRGTQNIELFETKKNDQEFTKLTRIEGLFDEDKYWKSNPVLSPDGKYLVFNAYGTPLGEGGEDIYVAQKTGKGWSKAKSIGKLVNTKNEEGSARFSRDGKYFFFSREEKENPNLDGIWSIYFVETKYLGLNKLFNN
ncbi:MAG: PD40 domain-containing protein [Bacteroidetes Order II. Incertae sedis bacterium]|nr:PD40 domain-containing protein [Bacteroidetes Order II. bacterium]